jgi:hypothetical protein
MMRRMLRLSTAKWRAVKIDTVALSLSKGSYQLGVLRQAQGYGYDLAHELPPSALHLHFVGADKLV